MSMRFGTSITFRTRPRCLRIRKFDWMTLAIGAPDVFVCDRCDGASSRSARPVRRTTGNVYRSLGALVRPALDLFAAVELSLKFARVKQKPRRPRGSNVLREKYCANSTVKAAPSLPPRWGREQGGPPMTCCAKTG